MSKRTKKIVRDVIMHLIIVLAVVLLTFLIIDTFFNTSMGFLANNFFKYTCIIFVILSVVNVGMHLYTLSRKRKKNDQNRNMGL